MDENSFAQIYLDVDDLFEEYDHDDVNLNDEATREGNNDTIDDNIRFDQSSEPTTEDPNFIPGEIRSAFLSIYHNAGKDHGDESISKNQLREWKEVCSLIKEELLSEDEFDELFEKSLLENPNDDNNELDLRGFSYFNTLLDDLFEFGDDEDNGLDDEGDDDDNDLLPKTALKANLSAKERSMVIEGDQPLTVLFSNLCDGNCLVGMEELNLWVELKEMIDDGTLLLTEVEGIYDKYVTSPNSKLNEDDFIKFYSDIDDLFEDEDGENIDAENEQGIQTTIEALDTPKIEGQKIKADLLSFLNLIIEDDDEPCGFGTTEPDQDQLLNIVNLLEKQPTNRILQKKGDIQLCDVAGNWNLVYTSSSAMKFNNGVTGVGGTIPNGRFAGVRQELKATKFVSDMQYKERIELTPSTASFDVTVNGSWDLQTSVSLFTGQPSIILYVEPDRVSYGPTSMRADHWKSLGPLNRLDLSYIDDDLRIMRG